MKFWSNHDEPDRKTSYEDLHRPLALLFCFFIAVELQPATQQPPPTISLTELPDLYTNEDSLLR